LVFTALQKYFIIVFIIILYNITDIYRKSSSVDFVFMIIASVHFCHARLI